MGPLNEFIKEHSPETPKKKKRVRLKNLNPFRKRKYKQLNEDSPDWVHGRRDNNSSWAASERPKSQVNSSDPSCAKSKHKRAGPRELLQAAWGSLGLGKGNPDDPNSGKRKKARRHGAYGRLVEEDTPLEATTGDAGETAQTPTDSQSESDGEGRAEERAGSEVKHVTIYEGIEVIEEEEQEPPKKKKKSAKKKIKKAGIKTAKYLGHGLSNMALTFQYMTPEAALAPATREMAQRREERLREMHSHSQACAMAK